MVGLQHGGVPAPQTERGGNDEPERGGNGASPGAPVAGGEEGRGGRANGPGVGLGGCAARLRLASLRICSPNCAELRTHGPRRGPERGDTRTGRRMRLERRGETATARGWAVSHLTSGDRGLGTSGAAATGTRRRSRSRKAWLQGATPTLDGPCGPPQIQSRGCWLPSSGSLGSTPGLDGRMGLS